MPRCIVVADDLTGANATGVLLSQQGFVTQTLLREAWAHAASLSECDCIMIPTDSRAIDPEEAYERVKEALGLFSHEGVKHFAKRVDSTLRGNLGREIDACLDVLGDGFLAVCMPSSPASGRALVGSHLLVHGVPLHQTEAARDPKCPIHISDGLALLRAQSHYPVGAVRLDDLALGVRGLSERFKQLYAEGVRIVLADAITNDDIETVCDALVLSGLSVISADPGPFTAQMGKRMLAKQTSSGKVLCAIGSVNGVAARQARQLLNSMTVTAVYLQTEKVLEGPESRSAEIERVVAELSGRLEESDVLAVIGNGIDPAHQLSLSDYTQKRGLSVEELSEEINSAFAEAVMRLTALDSRIRGVYSTGGDISAAIHRLAGTVGLRLYDEVVPLAGYGQAIGGTLNGLHMISKGGMVGDERAMVTCVRYLKEHMERKA